MEGDDRKELARQRLSCFADGLMTDYSLSKAAVISDEGLYCFK